MTKKNKIFKKASGNTVKMSLKGGQNFLEFPEFLENRHPSCGTGFGPRLTGYPYPVTKSY